MKARGRWARLAMMMALVPGGSLRAQQNLPGETAGPATPLDAARQGTMYRAPGGPLVRELDLLRRDGFTAAEAATILLRVVDKSGARIRDLQGTDISLTVNGTVRTGRLQAPGGAMAAVSPLVLLVFPPNQPLVHTVGVRAATNYFRKQPGELLSWKVGILDSNGKLQPFTNGRSQLLANLDLVDHAIEPFQYTSDGGLPASFHWEGSWLTKAEEAISMMQRFDGPKVILAMNPLAEAMYGQNERVFAHDGPESLRDMAPHIGAHIYIANVGGPEVLIPGGSAAQNHPAQVNTPGGLILGTSSSSNMQVSPAQTAALNYFAYRTSVMMQTEADSVGEEQRGDAFSGHPMRAADCRLRAEPTDSFASTDTLHAFVRLYPSGRWKKRGPESWTASFTLRSSSGTIETEREMPFTVDSGSGYLAYVELPLNAESIRAGAHTLDVHMRGPGIRNDLEASRPISIAAPHVP